MRIISKSQQAHGVFNNGQIIENKPIGFPQDGGFVRPYSSLFYWAHAEGVVDSTIGLHPHQGFEIMSFVLNGNVRHFDTKINDWKPLQIGDVQIIRAGNGISHSEFLEKGSAIFQIWVDPDLSKTLNKNASYDDYKAADFITEKEGATAVTYYAGERGIMKLDTPDIDIRRLLVSPEWYEWKAEPGKIRSMYVIKGGGIINGKTLEQDDFIIVEEGEDASLLAHELMDVFVITSAANPGYKTYMERRSY
jgi:redox-sensitive bicupin YhaK (pirin superfamily)